MKKLIFLFTILVFCSSVASAQRDGDCTKIVYRPPVFDTTYTIYEYMPTRDSVIHEPYKYIYEKVETSPKHTKYEIVCENGIYRHCAKVIPAKYTNIRRRIGGPRTVKLPPIYRTYCSVKIVHDGEMKTVNCD